MTYGLATAVIGGTAPLVGSRLAQRGVPLEIPAHVAALSAAGLLQPTLPATATDLLLEPPSEGPGATSTS